MACRVLRSSRSLGSKAALVLCAGLVGFQAPSMAQEVYFEAAAIDPDEVMEFTSISVPMLSGLPMLHMGGHSWGGALARPDIEVLSQRVSFDADQLAVALDLFDAYESERRDAQRAHYRALEEMYRAQENAEKADETDLHKHFERYAEMEEQLRTHSKAARKTLLEDIKSLASDEQLEHWQRVSLAVDRWERGQSVMGSAAIDLVRTLAQLKVPVGGDAGLALTLDRYEREIAGVLAQAKKAEPDAMEDFDFEQFEAMRKQNAEHRRDAYVITKRFVRILSEALAEEQREPFNTAVQDVLYAEVYAPVHLDMVLKAIYEMEDLTDEQRAAVTDIESAHRMRAKGLNDAWVRAIDEDRLADPSEDESPQSGIISMAVLIIDGETVVTDQSDDDSNAERKARIALDAKTVERLQGGLTPEQLASLPTTKKRTMIVNGQEVEIGDMPEGMENVQIEVNEGESATITIQRDE